MTVIPDRDQLVALLERVAEYRPSRTVRRIAGVAALLVFLGSLGLAVRHLPTLDLHPRWLFAAAAGALGVFGVNAAEFRLAGHLARRPLPWGDAAEKTIWATAANLLPVPGGPLVRLQAVADGPGGWSKATRTTLVPSAGWFAATFLAAGAALGALGWPGLAIIAAALGMTATVGTGILVPPEHRSLGSIATIGGLEVAFVAVSALRLVALFAALGHPVGFLPAVVLTTAAVLATAAGVFPGGLGLREVFSAVVASLLGVPPALAILVSALDRVVGLGTISLLAVLHQATVPEAEPVSRKRSPGP